MSEIAQSKVGLEKKQLDQIADSLAESDLPNSFPGQHDVENWLESRVDRVLQLEECRTSEDALVLKLWHETQAMLIGMQVKQIPYEPDFSEIICPLRRLILRSRSLSESMSTNPSEISSRMKAEDFVRILRNIYTEFHSSREAAQSIPRWCQPRKTISSSNFSNRDIVSIENGELDDVMEQLRQKLTNAEQQHIGNVDCNSDELEILLILSGLSQCNLPDESRVILPEWLLASNKYAKTNERCKPYIQSLVKKTPTSLETPLKNRDIA